MENSLISIIIPNFNKEKFISKTINSVINQTYANWELIIVDDGSTDNSISVIKEFVASDNRIVLLERDRLPKGGSVCRNIGLEKSKGDFIIFLDSDDVLASSALEKRIELIKSKENLDFIVSSMGTFYHKVGDSNSVWNPTANNHLKKFLSHDLPWSVMQPLWRKSFLLKLKGFDEEFPRLQDVELHTRALMQKDVNFKINSNTTPDCFYRIDENRIIDNYDEFISKWVDGSLLYVEKMFLEIEKYNVDVSERKSALKGTVISMLNHILYQTVIENIEIIKRDELINRIIDNDFVVKLGSVNTLKMYIKFHKIGFYKFKGFNFLSKKIITI